MKRARQLLELRTTRHIPARDRKDTKLMGEFMLNSNRPPDFWGDKGITGFGDGVTIRQKNQVIGGIGVSGLSEEEDERIAYAAIKAVYGKIAQ